jgi:hypothetical protein
VEACAAFGIPEADICAMVTHPGTGQPIDPKTLRRHFRSELDRAFTQAKLKVAGSLYKNATTATKAYPGGIPVAQIFFLKTRARWSDRPAPIEPPPPPEQTQTGLTWDDARRILFMISKAKSSTPKPATPSLPKNKTPA